MRIIDILNPLGKIKSLLVVLCLFTILHGNDSIKVYRNQVFAEFGGSSFYSLNYQRILAIKSNYSLNGDIGSTIFPYKGDIFTAVLLGLDVDYKAKEHLWINIGINYTSYFLFYNNSNKIKEAFILTIPKIGIKYTFQRYAILLSYCPFFGDGYDFTDHNYYLLNGGVSVGYYF